MSDIAAQVAVYCSSCDMWLPGNDQWEDHKIGKKHKKKTGKGKSTSSRNKLVIPAGTALILEQEALEADAVMQYTLSLYRRAALRANL